MTATASTSPQRPASSPGGNWGPGFKDRFGGRLLIVIATVFLGFAAMGTAVLLIPLNSYWYGAGSLRYRHENPLVADFEGVITEMIRDGSRPLDVGDSILIYHNREEQMEAELLSRRILTEKQELGRLQALFKLGQIDDKLILKNKSFLGELELSYRRKKDNVFRARIPGKIHYILPPEKLPGRYLEKGTPLGIVYEDGPKTVEISMDLSFADRIPEGSPVVIYYKSVSRFFSLRLESEVTARNLNLEEGRLILRCDVDPSSYGIGRQEWSQIEVGTPFQVRILANKASLFDRFFRNGDNGNQRTLRAIKGLFSGL